MAITLTAETGAGVADANTYATRAQADQYHEGRLHTAAWTSAAPAVKDQALVMATRFLDANITWQGNRIDINQALAWPRKSVTWDGHPVPEDMLPKPVVDATCELARLLITADLQADQENDNIKSLNLGNSALEIEFKDGSKTRRIPLAIGEILQGIGGSNSGNGITQRKVTR
jgi:hypothetical protein